MSKRDKEEKRKHHCGCEEENKQKEMDLIDQIKKCIYPQKPCKPPGSCTCPPGSCTCPPGSCTCPPGSCTCPPGSCTCPPESCTCPPGSCTCPEGACPQTVELVQNPSFEIPCTVPPDDCDVFEFWTGDNIAESDDSLTGDAAAELGASPSANATLEQTICGINPGCPYEFSFSVNAQNLSGNGQFTAQVFWLPSNTPAIDPAVNPIVIDERVSGNNYVFIKRITNLAPPGTTCARILFTKTGTGSVLVDDVSFRG